MNYFGYVVYLIATVMPLHNFERYADWRLAVVVSGVRRMNEVNARRARLLPGWVTVFGWVYHLSI